MRLRQGCVLSPLLFSLYVNGMVTRLHDGKCGMQCGGDKVPGLLFTNDTSCHRRHYHLYMKFANSGGCSTLRSCSFEQAQVNSGHAI